MQDVGGHLAEVPRRDTMSIAGFDRLSFEKALKQTLSPTTPIRSAEFLRGRDKKLEDIRRASSNQDVISSYTEIAAWAKPRWLRRRPSSINRPSNPQFYWHVTHRPVSIGFWETWHRNCWLSILPQRKSPLRPRSQRALAPFYQRMLNMRLNEAKSQKSNQSMKR